MVDGLTKTAGQLPAPPAGMPQKARFLGVDVARGVALLSMLGANVFDILTDDGRPTLSAMTVLGRSATMFVLVAGISLAFITGGRHPVQGRTRRAARASIAVRALLIGAIGLALGYVAPDSLGMILPYYGLLFLLAIPLVGLRPRTLASIAGAVIAVGPLLRLASFYLDLEPAFHPYPTFSAPFSDPIGLALQLLVTGDFPVVVYLAYICAGLAIGRLDLSSTKVAVRLLCGGLALAVAAWFTSSVLVFHLGGLQHLLAASPPGTTPTQIVWDSDPIASWWWLALRVHHSGTPLDVLHTLGAAMAVLGGVLLVTRLRSARRVLWPVGVAGATTLTIYSAHVLVLASGLLSDDPLTLYLVLAVVVLIFSVLWRWWRGQGPLERLVAMGADRVRAAVLASPAHAEGGRSTVTAPLRRITATWRAAVLGLRGRLSRSERGSANYQGDCEVAD